MRHLPLPALPGLSACGKPETSPCEAATALPAAVALSAAVFDERFEAKTARRVDARI